LTFAALAGAGGWILYSNLAIDHNAPLPDALPAERKTFQSQAAEQLSYYRGPVETGRPLVLLHSINAAASAYEMRPLFLHYRNQRPVYALDLPGYGFSERANRAYAPRVFEDAIVEFLATQVGEAADVVALSLSCEFAASAALARPDLFNSLSLISPTGLSLKNAQRGSQQAGQSGFSEMLYPAFSFPLWGRPFYDLIATRKSIVYFLQQSFMGPVPDDLVTYAYATSHQPGAEYVPLHFISGKLFNPEVRERVYEQVQTPTLVLYDRDAFTSFELLPELLARNPAWQAVRIVPTLGLPHFERPEETTAVLDRFWQ
jgi:pimeloyl-ACP methyl ester carboxylesterase